MHLESWLGLHWIWRWTCHLTKLMLAIHKLEMSFHLFVSSLVFFSATFYSFPYGSPFASLVKFIPKYFIVFDATVNGIVFLISFSNVSLLVYRNATVFSMLIFCPANSLNLFSSNKFFGVVFRFLHMYGHVICKQTQFYFFSYLDDFISFFYIFSGV